MSESPTQFRRVAGGTLAVPNNTSQTVGPWTLLAGEALMPFARVIQADQGHGLSLGNDNNDVHFYQVIAADGTVTYQCDNNSNDDISLLWVIWGSLV